MKTSLTSPGGTVLLCLGRRVVMSVKDSKHGSFPTGRPQLFQQVQGKFQRRALPPWRSPSNKENASMASPELVSPFDLNCMSRAT